jgi:hypothetical protein
VKFEYIPEALQLVFKNSVSQACVYHRRLQSAAAAAAGVDTVSTPQIMRSQKRQTCCQLLAGRGEAFLFLQVRFRLSVCQSSLRWQVIFIKSTETVTLYLEVCTPWGAVCRLLSKFRCDFVFVSLILCYNYPYH